MFPADAGMNRIIPTLETPNEIWLVRYENDRYRQRYIKIWDDNRGLVSIIDERQDGLVLYNVMSRRPIKDLNALRLGKLLWPKDG